VRLRRVLAYIEDHLDQEISLAALARVACFSEFHFSGMFAAAMRLSPHRYVSQRRLERAMELIAQGGAPLSEIALRSCFSSQASFSRAFRRTTGMTPGEYRRHIG
jgi:AraC family transcriptional regulator